MSPKKEELELGLDDLAELQVVLGLGTMGTDLVVADGALPLDLNPWAGDACVARISRLGHHDVVPRPWDWENLLPLLGPGEELLWVVDYDPAAEQSGRSPVEVHLALRFAEQPLDQPEIVEERRRRFTAFVSQLRRQAFPESVASVGSPEEVWQLFQRGEGTHLERTLCVAGIPSPKDLADEQRYVSRDAEQRAFSSLNDVVETGMGLEAPFRLVFVVGRVDAGALNDEMLRTSSLVDLLAPLVSQQTQAADSIAQGNTRSKGETKQEGGSRQAPRVMGRNLWRQMVNLGRLGRSKMGGQVDLQEEDPSHSWSNSSSDTRTASRTQTSGTAITHETLRSDLSLAKRSLERYLDDLFEARGTGGYQGAVFVMAETATAGVLADALRGVLSGSRSKDRPLDAFDIKGPSAALLASTWPLLPQIKPAAPVLSLQQACHLLLLPEAELQGLSLQQSVFLGRNAVPHTHDGGRTFSLGPDPFGTTDATSRDVELPSADLFRHLLICGTTGSGKTYRALRILQGLGREDDLRVLVFETAKRTYRSEFVRQTNDPIVYRVGDASYSRGSRFRPLRINPFFFEPGTPLKRHVSVLSEALSELLPIEAMIGPYMREAVEACYAQLGWDIERSAWLGEGPPRYPRPTDFVVETRRLAETLQYGPEVSANYRGALEARAHIFLDATFQDLFSHDGNRILDELFPRDAVIEFEDLPPSEIDIPAFVMTLLLSRLRAAQARDAQGAKQRPWLVVVEEAHNVLSREMEGQGDARESNAGRLLLDTVVRLLQEGRALKIGLMIIDQSPALLARSVIKNTNTKVVLRLEDGAEIDELGHTLGLDETGSRNLGVLQPGQALIKAPYMSRPTKSAPYGEAGMPRLPNEQNPPSDAQAPSYVRLERLWRQVLELRVVDEEWSHALEESSQGSAELAAFGLVATLLRLRVGVEDHRVSRARELLSRPDIQLAEVVAAARRWVRADRRMLVRNALLLVERRLFAGYLGVPPCAEDPLPASEAVTEASRILGGQPAWLPQICAYGGRRFQDLARPLKDELWEALLRLRHAQAMFEQNRLVTLAERQPADELVVLQASLAHIDPLIESWETGSNSVHEAAEDLARALARWAIHRCHPGLELHLLGEESQ